MRPGPRRPCAISNPRPSPRSIALAGTRTFSNAISMCPCGASLYPNTWSGRRTLTPGALMGTRIIDCCRWSSPVVAVLPITMSTAHLGSPAPEVHHLRPLITYSSPSRSMRVQMFDASDDATAGSVIANPERMRPSSSGSSHCRFWSSVP
eukprot:Amastigsp_a187915_2.p3 type:complete len:150 gc:universal Amastigsp_a187915_2:371-820(+)